MYKKLFFILTLLVMMGVSTHAQDEVVIVGTVDYMADPLNEIAPLLQEEFGVAIEIESYNEQEMVEAIMSDGISFDIVIAPTQTFGVIEWEKPEILHYHNCWVIDPTPPECFPPRPFPWPIPEPFPSFPWPEPWPPCLSCPPPIIWDVEMILQREDIVIDDFSDMVDIFERGTVGVALDNVLGFEITPGFEQAGFAPENMVMGIEEADVMITLACNYIHNFEEYTAAGFSPALVNGYTANSFGITAQPITGEFSRSGNVELATQVIHSLYASPDIQRSLFDMTGMLPSHGEVLNEVIGMAG